jgi:hypothetical protein
VHERVLTRASVLDGVGAGLAVAAYVASLVLTWGNFGWQTPIILAVPTILACLPLVLRARPRRVARLVAIFALLALIVSSVGFLFLPSALALALGAMGRR